MLKILMARLRQGHRTIRYPRELPALPDRFRGRPLIEPGRCGPECQACVEACAVGAVVRAGAALQLDLGRCLFCGDCERVCPHGALRFSQGHQMAARERQALVLDGREAPLKAALDRRLRKLFGRSLKLRQVSAGGCAACEADVNVLNTVVFDLGRFGIQFVAAPRHADGLLITGPVPRNMELALRKTYEAVPSPRLVVAVGACAVAGGPYVDHAEVRNGAAAVVPVDLYIPGCPPHPLTILDGLLRMLGTLEDNASTSAAPTQPALDR